MGKRFGGFTDLQVGGTPGSPEVELNRCFPEIASGLGGGGGGKFLIDR